MRLLFLDIDGVLNNQKFWKTQKYKTFRDFDYENVRNLNTIIRKADPKIVLSSSWRLSIGFEFPELSDFEEFLRGQGCCCNGHFIGVTRINEPWGDPRSAHIQDWLTEHKFEGLYCALDDDQDVEPHPSVIVDSQVGLTKQDAERVIKILLGE